MPSHEDYLDRLLRSMVNGGEPDPETSSEDELPEEPLPEDVLPEEILPEDVLPEEHQRDLRPFGGANFKGLRG